MLRLCVYMLGCCGVGLETSCPYKSAVKQEQEVLGACMTCQPLCILRAPTVSTWSSHFYPISHAYLLLKLVITVVTLLISSLHQIGSCHVGVLTTRCSNISIHIVSMICYEHIRLISAPGSCTTAAALPLL